MIESVSRRAFCTSSGTYNVHARELAAARDRKLKGFNVRVRLLDDTEHSFIVPKRAKGSLLLDMVFRHLELVEQDYFGLQYTLEGPNTFICPENMRWLEPNKNIKKQLSNMHESQVLHFRVKFYVCDPSKLQGEYTRYQFYLQVRKDIFDRRLCLPPSTAMLLASYSVQSELGDYQPDEHCGNYLRGMRLIPDQTEDLELKIIELHKLHQGQLPSEAEFNFLDHAKRMEMYGVILHAAKDSSSKQLLIGVTHSGLVVFQHQVRINTFCWSKVMKISFKRKQFFVHLLRELSENYDTILGFNMDSYRSAKLLWKCCVEHHAFFRLHSPKIRRKFALSLGSRFTFVGRTELQTNEQTRIKIGGQRRPRKFIRSPTKFIRQATLPIITRSPSPARPIPTVHIPASVPPLTANLDEQRLHPTAKTLLASVRSSSLRPYDNKVTSAAAKEPRKAWEDEDHAESQLSDDDGGFLDRVIEGPFSPAFAGRVMSYADEEPISPASNNDDDNEENESIGRDAEVSLSPEPRPGSSVIGSSADSDMFSHSPRLSGAASDDADTQPVSSGDVDDLIDDDPSTVDIILYPDQDMRYGFNVKGGTSTDVPIVVSRVGANTSADRSLPRLTEGDQLLQINGVDVSHVLHHEVVELIQRARTIGDGRLELQVRPNALYLSGGAVNTPANGLTLPLGETEPPFRYVPAFGDGRTSGLLQLSPATHLSQLPQLDDNLGQSMLLLIDGLASGSLVTRYDMLYRTHSELSCMEANRPSNINKNRYRDIAPYDATRVILSDPPNAGEDYINANYVNMVIGGGGATEGVDMLRKCSDSVSVNRYIATQGPLAGTVEDFWQMILEQRCDLVVMLTTLMERGRVKCHAYWPALHETLTMRHLAVRCDTEITDPTDGCVYRDLCLIDLKHDDAERRVRHMQYVAWPDHGVPESPSQFLGFVEKVRQWRRAGGPDAPSVVVHCSAGIGRTGVLVLMETALCLIEQGQPVYPLEIVKTMRDQRAMMIQNASQYRFVCECVHAAYLKNMESLGVDDDDDEEEHADSDCDSNITSNIMKGEIGTVKTDSAETDVNR